MATVFGMNVKARVRNLCAMLLMIPAALGATGCSVSQAEYDNLFATNRSLQEQNQVLMRERDEARASLDAIRGGINGREGAVSELSRQNAELKRQLDQALADLNSMGAKFGQLQIGSLDADTDRALRDLVSKYPNLISYDASRGMLRFASDLTFDSGSDVVKSEAKTALNALSQVLTSGAAERYDVLVEGHTDAQRISGGTAQRHPTNRHLSAHRAISVIRELASMGVRPEKMMAAGWGEYRPVVPNTGNGNTPQNRRVEIYLVKAMGTGMANNAPATTSVLPEQAAPPTRQFDVTK